MHCNVDTTSKHSRAPLAGTYATAIVYYNTSRFNVWFRCAPCGCAGRLPYYTHTDTAIHTVYIDIYCAHMLHATRANDRAHAHTAHRVSCVCNAIARFRCVCMRMCVSVCACVSILRRDERACSPSTARCLNLDEFHF